MATFLQTLEPLVKAAEEYAKEVKAYEYRKANGFIEAPMLLELPKERLLEAAIEFAKWGSK